MVFVISTGLSAAYPSVSMVGMFITVILTIVVYTMICLYFPQDFQLKVAQLLTFLFSVIMTITFVGLLAGIADDIIKNTSPKTTSNVTATLAPNTLHMATEEVLKLAPSNIYLVFLAALFICTALLHGFEGLSVIHGIWYLLCLPSGYLFLTIYSVANMTDRSWGKLLNLDVKFPTIFFKFQLRVQFKVSFSYVEVSDWNCGMRRARLNRS